jgi:hypothetical protein
MRSAQYDQMQPAASPEACTILINHTPVKPPIPALFWVLGQVVLGQVVLGQVVLGQVMLAKPHLPHQHTHRATN